MAKVNVHTEAKAKATKPDSEIVYVKDAKGRKLGLKRLPFLEEFRIVEAVGPERAINQAYMSMINPLLLIAEIDGDPISTPRTHAQIEALIQRAGREGFSAAFDGMMKHFADDPKELDQKIKNVDSTPASETASGS
jgi:hypothetical protein